MKDELVTDGKTPQELRVTKERVLLAASKCSTARATLQALFPEAFEGEPYQFAKGLSDTITVRTTTHDPCPLYLGMGNAPDGLSGRCLMVKPTFEMRVTETPNGKALSFVRRA